VATTIWRTAPGRSAGPTAVGSSAAFFPREEVAQVKAIACELPKTHGVPLSRFSRSELHRFVVEQAVSEASALYTPERTDARYLPEAGMRCVGNKRSAAKSPG
jgi:hypothetical protein